MGKYKLQDQNEKFHRIIREFGIRSDKAKKAILLIARKTRFTKGHILKRQNTFCTKLYYIESGVSRTYYRCNGKEITVCINLDNSFITPVNGFITGESDQRNIEFLEDSVVYAIHYRDIERLADKSYEIERFVRNIAEFGLRQMQQKMDELYRNTSAIFSQN